jgi:hypothetical protein
MHPRWLEARRQRGYCTLGSWLRIMSGALGSSEDEQKFVIFSTVVVFQVLKKNLPAFPPVLHIMNRKYTRYTKI